MKEKRKGGQGEERWGRGKDGVLGERRRGKKRERGGGGDGEREREREREKDLLKCMYSCKPCAVLNRINHPLGQTWLSLDGVYYDVQNKSSFRSNLT